MIGDAPATAWYVYGVAAAGRELDEVAPALAPVLVVEDGPIAAIAGAVSRAEFAEQALSERLNDRQWLEEKARAHEDVLQTVAAATAVVPFRFGTVYHELADVRRLLDARREELEASLARVRGHVELGVKAWLDERRFEATLDASNAAPGSGGAGRAYLEARRRERTRAAEAAARRADLAEGAHARLLGVAVDGVANRPQPPELTGRGEQMLLNGAYLVPAGDTVLRDEVERLAAEHAPLGVAYEVTGPWPPHNFVGDPEGAP